MQQTACLKKKKAANYLRHLRFSQTSLKYYHRAIIRDESPRTLPNSEKNPRTCDEIYEHLGFYEHLLSILKFNIRCDEIYKCGSKLLQTFQILRLER